ncbi:glycosyltransferase [Patescibacteria group bacterium]
MLSIVIPTLNEEDHLPKLLKTIKSQTFKNYEIIVSDADSKDKTLKIAEIHGCKIVKGGLPAKGRNEGVRAAQGDLILFLDADIELPSKDFIEKALKEFKDKELDLAACFLKPLGEVKFIKKNSLEFLFRIVNLLLVLFEKNSPFGAGSMILVKKDFHQKINGFDENIRMGEDTVYVRKGARKGKFGILRSVKILWSVRRLQRESWLKVILVYILCGILAYDEKKLEIFKKSVFKYEFGHYKEAKLPKINFFDFKKIKDILKSKIKKV